MKIALIGYGKMGKAIEEVAKDRGHEIVLRVTRDSGDWRKEIHQADVAIEFTQPSSAFKHLSDLIEAGIPTVTGTTGWYADYPQVKQLVESNNGSFLAATNFSIGVNLVFAVNSYLAKLMNTHNEYDVEIEEIHHLQKLDAPSGTGISMAQQVLAELDRKNHWVCDESPDHVNKGTSDELVIHAKREDGVPGTHHVRYFSDIDTIELTHIAHNRKGFAAGAVLAAEYIFNKKGIFTMNDVLRIPHT
jgi:4-hydroxy-tetrahydrodipicolinate reductase